MVNVTDKFNKGQMNLDLNKLTENVRKENILNQLIYFMYTIPTFDFTFLVITQLIIKITFQEQLPDKLYFSIHYKLLKSYDDE